MINHACRFMKSRPTVLSPRALTTVVNFHPKLSSRSLWSQRAPLPLRAGPFSPKIHCRFIHQKHFLQHSADVEIIDELVETKIEDAPYLEDKDLVTFRDTRIQDVLNDKAIQDLHFIHDSQTVFEAIRSMNEKKIGALLVKNYEGKICGIITERDYLNKVALKGLRSWETKVDSIMTPNPRGVTPKATVMRCLTLMTHYRFRHLVVLSESDQAVIGLVSIGDLVKAVLEQYKETIYFLREYIEKRW